jgi:hypothetical protein
MSQGCFPFFLDIDKIPTNTLTNYPKDKIKQWMNKYSQSDFLYTIKKHSSSDLYYDINELLNYTRTNLSTSSMIDYLYNTTNHSISEDNSVLIVTENKFHHIPYIPSNLIYGFKQRYGTSVYESAVYNRLYESYPQEELINTYGRGMNYSRIIPDKLKVTVSEDEILEKIKSREFDTIVYSEIHGSIQYLDTVCKYYDLNDIFLFCGMDCDSLCDPTIGWVSSNTHTCFYNYMFQSGANFFVRELGETNYTNTVKLFTNEQFSNGMSYFYDKWTSMNNY